MRTRSVRAVVMVLPVLAVACAVGCSNATEPSEDRLDDDRLPSAGSLELTVHFQDYGRWELTGPLVDAGVVCAHGYSRETAARDSTTGEALSTYDFNRRLSELSGPTDDVNMVFVIERRCADGSGSFVTEDDSATGLWTVTSGTGAYATMRGHGGVDSFVMDLDGFPEYISGTLELDLDTIPRIP